MNQSPTLALILREQLSTDPDREPRVSRCTHPLPRHTHTYTLGVVREKIQQSEVVQAQEGVTMVMLLWSLRWQSLSREALAP